MDGRTSPNLVEERGPEPTCFYPNSANPDYPWIGEPKSYACGPYSSKNASRCCYINGFCMTHGVCYQPYVDISDTWYVPGCTDPSGKDPACAPYSQCGISVYPNIKHLHEQTWQCCWGRVSRSNEACVNPYGKKFDNAPPEKLVATAFIDDGGTAHPTHKAFASFSQSQTQPSHHRLGGGDIAGIVVGSVCGAALIIALVWYYIMAQRKLSWRIWQREGDPTPTYFEPVDLVPLDLDEPAVWTNYPPEPK